MLTKLTKIFRVKTAIFVAALYAFAILVPHAALALGGPNAPIHCLTQTQVGNDHAAPKTHIHADGTAHTHSDNNTKNTLPDSDNSKAPPAACCGLFTATALTYDTRILLPSPISATKFISVFASEFTGQGPGRIIRPPIT